MANAQQTIQQVQQCTTLQQLAELEQQEAALPRARKTVLDAILEQRVQLTTVAGKGRQAQEAKEADVRHGAEHPAAPTTNDQRPATAPQAQFKSMSGRVVVFGREYTKEEALKHPDVMAALVRRKSLTLVGN